MEKLWPLLLVMLSCLPACRTNHYLTLIQPIGPAIVAITGPGNTISVSDYEDLTEGKEQVLKKLSIGILPNPHRQSWNSKVDNEVKDRRGDENRMLAEYLRDTGLFGKVVLLKELKQKPQVDYILSCNIDCIYTIELDAWMYTINTFLTLGVGYLLGWPHQDSTASYVAQVIVYDNRGERPITVSSSLVENLRHWYYDNIYWRPDFYGPAAYSPLFEQILYDFIARSGCLGGR